jgi:hypothetical protein
VIGAPVKFLVPLCAGLLLSGKVAQAQTIPETLRDFGFLGTWAIHCEEPASPSNNTRFALISSTGDVVFRETLGPHSEPNVYVVLRAVRESDDTLALLTKVNGEFEQELTVVRKGGRLRTFRNVDVATGRVVVRQGTVVSTGQRTPWLSHCDEPPSQ